MNIENILKLRDFLRDEVPDENFNMKRIFVGKRKDVAEHVCNTAACIGGWGMILFDVPDIGGNLAEVLGLRQLSSADDTWTLMDEVCFGGGVDYKATRLEAVDMLTNLAETGEVDWSAAEARWQAEQEASSAPKA